MSTPETVRGSAPAPVVAGAGPARRPGDRVRVIHRAGFCEVRCPRCNSLCCKATPGSVVEIVCQRCDDMMIIAVEK